MIAVRLMGGLGNQMFQYAAGKRLALHHKTQLVLDTSHYLNQPKEEVSRHYELDCFSLDAKLVEDPIEQTGFKKIFRKIEPNIINEKSFSFDPDILHAPDNSLLVGYWQSEKYFQDVAENIIRDFSFMRPLSPAKQKIAEEIDSAGHSVSLQVRRGDYVYHKQSSHFHGALSLNYYDKAIEALTKVERDPHFFVISDDPGWCRTHLKIGYPSTFVEHIPGTGHEDMRLTSLCDHNIIANSTFSWWGAWLNQNPKKLVIAPKKWFKDPKNKTPDVLPDSWVRV